MEDQRHPIEIEEEDEEDNYFVEVNPGDGKDAVRREPLEHEPFDQEKIWRPLMMIYQFFADLVYRN